MQVRRLLLLAIVLAWGCVAPKPIVPPPLDQLTPLVGHVIAEPRPVLGADNRIHLPPGRHPPGDAAGAVNPRATAPRAVDARGGIVRDGVPLAVMVPGDYSATY